MENEIASVTDSTFDDEVLKSSTPVLVDFWAPWCAPCVALSPILGEVMGERQGEIRVVKMNIEQNERVPAKYRVMSLPTLTLFDGGEMLRSVVRPSGKSGIDAFLDAATAKA